MQTVTLYLPTEKDLAQMRMRIRPTLEQAAAEIASKITREMYGCTEGTIQLVFNR
jgi:hypothetical protein